MKELFVSIVNYDTPPIKFDENAYAFKTEQDRELFASLIPDLQEKIRNKVGNRTMYGYYLAWRILERLGWWHDGNDDTKRFLRWVFPENTIERLELELKHHDWTYQYSDDFRWYSAGNEQRKRIETLMEEVGEPLATELYNKYAH